jgi:predicted O-methyltransferase YrrM
VGGDLSALPALYERYFEDLRRAREAQRELYERSGYSPWQRFPPYRWLRTALRRIGIDRERTRYMNPKLDDMEAELTYLRIRDRRPATVVEISPFRGWSTTWILRALEDNGEGSLVSFDHVEDSRRFVPAELAGRWTLISGDVRDRTSDMPEPIDYLFIDSDHRRTFAEWYLAELIPRLAPGAAVSVHDVFHGRGPGRGSGEARIVLDWLDRWRIRWVTPSRFGPGSFHDEVRAQRLNLGLGPLIHHGDHNSMILFDVPEGPGPRSRGLMD